MDTPLETEAKFVCTEEINKDQITRISQALGLDIQWHKVKYHIDEYWDTTDYLLFKSDVSLRCRKKLSEHPEHQLTNCTGTLKLPKARNGAILERYELEWSITQSTDKICFPDTFPADLNQSLAKYIAGRELLSVLEVITSRQTAYISRFESFAVECALDQSIFKGKHGETSQKEMELELQKGNAEEFAVFTTGLQKELNLQPSSNSKYAFGIQAVVIP
jgi:inorganic triphosphatase YgiF